MDGKLYAGSDGKIAAREKAHAAARKIERVPHAAFEDAPASNLFPPQVQPSVVAPGPAALRFHFLFLHAVDYGEPNAVHIPERVPGTVMGRESLSARVRGVR